MNTATEKDILRRQFFNEAAEEWEVRNYPPETAAKTESLIAELEIASGMTILDVGCGRGILIPMLRGRAGQRGRLVALDASAPMLAGVADKDDGAFALHARAESIPLLDEYVDMIVCFSAFPHFSDHPAAAREFHRVLKPGGTAHVLHLASREMINRHHDRHHAVAGDHMPDEKAMRAMFLAAGFASVNLREHAGEYRFSARKKEA
ncbi:MAG: methyltransferase domain-containing protein [Desulfovibrio sp.]|nr:methyltransferase domain-containing protein [Desulfovibrio sp.]